MESPGGIGKSRGRVILSLLTAITALALPLYLADFPAEASRRWPVYLGIMLAETGYLVIGFFYRPKLDTGERALCGGLIENPFRLPGPFSRLLFLLKLLLLPGRLVSQSLLDFIVMVSQQR